MTSNHFRGKILVMDDDEGIRFIAGLTLKRLGFDVVEAEDGSQAINQFKLAIEEGKAFTAVILDLNIPGKIGGKEVVKLLQEIDPGVVAYVSSGYCDDPIMMKCADYGFTGAIAKPFRYEDLKNIFGEGSEENQ